MLCPLYCDEAENKLTASRRRLLPAAESRVFRLPGHPCPASPPSTSCSAFCPLTHSAFPESSLLVPVLLLSGRAPPHSTLSPCLVTLSVSSRRPSWPRVGWSVPPLLSLSLASSCLSSRHHPWNQASFSVVTTGAGCVRCSPIPT